MIELVTRVGFIVIFALTLWGYVRHRNRARLDIVLMFGSFAGLIALQTIQGLRLAVPWIGTAASIALFAQPYLLLRLVEHVRPVRRVYSAFVLLGLAATAGILVAVPAPLPTPLTILIVTYFAVVESAAGIAFLGPARRAAGAVRWRSLLAAAAAGLLALVLLLAGLGTVVPGAPSLTTALSQGVALLAVLAYYVAFVPPRWLRRAWQLPELVAFVRSGSMGTANETAAFARLIGATARVVDAHGAIILRVAEDGRLVLVGGSEALSGARLEQPSHGAVAIAWRQTQPAIVSNTSTFDAADAQIAAPSRARALMAVPIPGGDRPLGVLAVPFARAPLFAADDLDLLALLAEHTGREIQTALLVREQQQAAHLRVLYSSARQLEGLRDRASASEAVMRCLREVLGYDRGWLALADDTRSALVGVAGYGTHATDEVIRASLPLRSDVAHPAVWAVLYGEPVLIDDPATDPRAAYDREILVELGVRNFATVPLLYQGVSVGALAVDNVPSGRAITPSQVELLQAFCALAAGALHSAQLFEEVAKLEAHREMDRLKSEFVGIVSHEFRTPLASLVGFSELLLTQRVPEAERREWIATMHGEAERLANLVEEVLDVSRIEEGRVVLQARPVDLTTALERVVATFGGQSTGHPLLLHYPERLPNVLADPDKVVQILTNLVSNAIKYSPLGGAVRITAESVDPSVRLSVADQGLGLPPDELPRLFNRFHRVHDAARREIPGSGLGLYITKHLVELQGGRIWAESPGPGRGSTFHVELPVTGAELARAA